VKDNTALGSTQLAMPDVDAGFVEQTKVPA
jgi:hypothetical protein